MFYRQCFDTFIRTFDDVGYIVNKKDFSDRVTDSSGTVFLSVLSREAKEFNNIVSEISNHFSDVNKNQLIKDIKQFYNILEKDGFIVSGNTEKELLKKIKDFLIHQFYQKL